MAAPLNLRIDTTLAVPAYRQIAGSLRAALVNATFRPGEALPTVRQLARDLGLNHNTVAQAYRLLAQEGWLKLHRGERAIVRQRAQPRAESGDLESFARRLRELVAEARAAGVPLEALQGELEAAAALLCV